MTTDPVVAFGELAQRTDVVGVLLFGSRARGDHRPDSDVDLVVIVRDGFRRCVEPVLRRTAHSSIYLSKFPELS